MKAENSEIRRLLRVKEEKKKKNPDFVRYESWRYVRVKESWRKPRGIDNKVRHKKKGHIRMPEIGFRKPKLVRGLHPSGFKPVPVTNPNDLLKLDPETEAAVIKSGVGARKREQILKKAEELGVKVLNP